MEHTRPWSTSGVRLRSVYRVAKDDLGRVGSCWMKGRLLAGDLVVPIEHAGDSFYTYQLIEGGNTRGETTVNEHGQLSYRLCRGAEFGAYDLGTLHDEQPSPAEWKRLMAGEATAFSKRLDVAKAMAEVDAERNREVDQMLENAVASLAASR